MKQMKNYSFLFIAFLGILFSGCEKDLYEDALVQNTITKGKIEFVKIDETPFLIPSVQSFNKDYEFLTKNKRSNREGLNLNLDLDHILEYVYANDLKTYSISVVKDFQANEDKYFENLNIYEKNGIYESFVLKYNPLDDTKAFDLKTFTGVLEIFDKNYVSQAIIQYEDGLSKCVKVTMGDWIIIFWGNGDISVGGPCLDGGNGGQNGGTSGWTGAGPTGGIAVSTASNSGTGTNGQSGNGSYSGNGISTIPVFVPYPTVTNAAQFIYNLGPEKASAFHLLKNNTQILVNNYIEQNLNNPEELGDVQTLLSNVVLITKISQLPVETEESIFIYLIQNVFSVDSKNFVNNTVKKIIENPNVFSSIKPFLIEKQINTDNLDTCTKNILNKLKANSKIAEIIARFENPESIFTLNLNQAVITPNPANPNSVIYGQTTNSNTSYLYNITLNSNYYNDNGATNLGKAKTIIHEILHALILSVIENGNGNALNNSDATNFPMIWNAYIDKKFNGDTNATHHLFIGNNYVKIIAEALQEYDTGIPVIHGQIPEQMYSDLAWSGLFALLNPTSPFDSILTSTDKARIYNRNNTEMNRSNSYGITPSSNDPCLN